MQNSSNNLHNNLNNNKKKENNYWNKFGTKLLLHNILVK